MKKLTNVERNLNKQGIAFEVNNGFYIINLGKVEISVCPTNQVVVTVSKTDEFGAVESETYVAPTQKFANYIINEEIAKVEAAAEVVEVEAVETVEVVEVEAVETVEAVEVEAVETVEAAEVEAAEVEVAETVEAAADLTFTEWFHVFLEEKGYDLEDDFEIKVDNDWHYMELGYIVNILSNTAAEIQDKVKETLVKIDFMNGDIMHFIKHLATGYIKANY